MISLKIVYISTSVLPSTRANSIHVMKMCQAFSKNGHQVTLFAIEGKHMDDIYEFYGVKNNFDVIRIKIPKYIIKGKGWVYSFQVRRFIKKNMTVDLVYSRDAKSLFLMKRLKKSLIYESHAISTWQRVKCLEKKLFQSVYFLRLVVISEALKTDYDDLYGDLIANKTIIAHDGADIPNQNDKTNPKADNRLTIGYIGHLYKGRGIDVIIHLAKKLSQFNFKIIGGNLEDIDYWKRNSIDVTNLDFLGYVPNGELSKYYKDLDIMLAPYQRKVAVAGNKNSDTSRWMSPMKLFEYMSYEKPIVCSNLPVLREVMKNDYNCLLCDPENIYDWTKAVLKFANDKDYRDRIAKQAFNDLENNYTWLKRALIVLEKVSIRN